MEAWRAGRPEGRGPEGQGGQRAGGLEGMGLTGQGVQRAGDLEVRVSGAWRAGDQLTGPGAWGPGGQE